MNTLFVKRKSGIGWEFKYEQNIHGSGYYFRGLFTRKTPNLYKLEFSWQFVQSEGHVPSIKILQLNPSGISWSDATKKCEAVSVRLSNGEFTFA